MNNLMRKQMCMKSTTMIMTKCKLDYRIWPKARRDLAELSQTFGQNFRLKFI